MTGSRSDGSVVNGPDRPVGSRRRRDDTLAGRFDPGANSLNVIRLVLAVMVILSHAALLGGYELPRPAYILFNEAAVDGFFALSGFLIARSWLRRPSWTRYLWHRALRILPAFWLALVVTAGVCGPLGLRLRGLPVSEYWTAEQGPVQYVSSNWLLWIGQSGIAGTPAGVPFPGVWNGSLWSMYWEFGCYLLLGLLGALGVLAGRRLWVLVAFALLWLLSVLRVLLPGFDEQFFDSFNAQVLNRLLLMFLCGTVLYLYREWVPLTGLLAAAAALLVLGGLFSGGDFRVLGGLAWAYLLLWIGTSWSTDFARRTDISYGVYVLAFPVQQLIVIAGWSQRGWLFSALLAVLLTVPVALLSWFVVERPVMRAKQWSPSWWARRGQKASARINSPVVGVVALVVVTALFASLSVSGWQWSVSPL